MEEKIWDICSIILLDDSTEMILSKTEFYNTMKVIKQINTYMTYVVEFFFNYHLDGDFLK